MSELDRIQFVELNSAAPLYAPQNDAFRSELAGILVELAEDPSLYDAIVIHQTASSQPVDLEFWQDLDQGLFLDELVETIYSFRVLLESIRVSSVPWIYLSEGDLLGSHFELAAACRERLLLSSQLQIGFPELALDLFPPGGTLEQNLKWMPKTDDLVAKPIRRAAKVSEGFVFLPPAAKTHAAIRKWLSYNIETLSPSSSASEGNSGNVERQTALKMAQELEKEWLDSGLGGGSYLQAYSQLLKRKGKFNRPQDFGWLVALLCAQKLLQKSYLTDAKVLKSQQMIWGELLAGASDGRVQILPLHINLDHLAPPAEVISALLREGVQLNFFAAEAGALSVSLSLIYPRLDRFFPAAELQEHWTKQVSWSLIDSKVRHGTVLTFSVDDQMIVSGDGPERVFLRLSGNHIDAPLGLVEYNWESDSSLSPELVYLLQKMASSVVVLPGMEGGELPVSQFFRALFFEEVLRVCQAFAMELTPMVELLAEAGWGFAGSDAGWDRYLKTKYDATFPVPVLEEFTQAEGRNEWEIGSWKQARAFVKHSRSSTSELRWNKTAISHHLCLFLGLLGEYAVAQLGETYRRRINLLSREALGIPEKFGLPLDYLARYGAPRVRYYAAKTWPNINLSRLPGVRNEHP